MGDEALSAIRAIVRDLEAAIERCEERTYEDACSTLRLAAEEAIEGLYELVESATGTEDD